MKSTSYFIFFFRSAVFLLLSYGLLYFSYKYYIPSFGGTDFYPYSRMIVNPWNFEGAIANSPFIYRQFNAIVASIIYNLGIFYEAEIAFSDPEFDQRVFFAAMLSNYIALFLTCVTVSKIVDTLVGRVLFYPSLLGGILCLLSFGTSTYVITGLAEGWTWFFIALGFYFYLHRKIGYLIVLLFVAILQKEIIIITFGVFSFSHFAFLWFRDKRLDSGLFYIFTLSIVCFAGYVIMRKLIFPVEGYENQLEVTSLIGSLLTFSFSKEIIFQTILSQNLLFLFLGMLFLLGFINKTKLGKEIFEVEKSEYILSLFVTVFMTYLIGIATGIGNNMGRLLLSLTPIIAGFIGYLSLRIENSFETNGFLDE